MAQVVWRYAFLIPLSFWQKIQGITLSNRKDLILWANMSFKVFQVNYSWLNCVLMAAVKNITV